MICLTIEGILNYSLYYMFALCAPIDLSKVELLRTNRKVAGMLFGVLCGCQYLIQALFLDVIIEALLIWKYGYYGISAINIICTLLAMGTIAG